MEEIKKINDDELDEVAGGKQTDTHYSPCFRCGKSDYSSYDYCTCNWYGKACCKECFKILNDLEQKGYLSISNISYQLKSLQDSIDSLSK